MPRQERGPSVDDFFLASASVAVGAGSGTYASIGDAAKAGQANAGNQIEGMADAAKAGQAKVHGDSPNYFAVPAAGTGTIGGSSGKGTIGG